MKIKIRAQLEFTVDVPTASEVDPKSIPAIYTPEEWADELLTEAVYEKCGRVPEWFTYEPVPNAVMSEPLASSRKPESLRSRD